MTNLLLSEFRKVTTLRYWWALGLAPLLVGPLSGVVSVPIVRGLTENPAAGETTPVAGAIGLLVALALVFVSAALFGAVHCGAEYRHHTMTATLLTARGRDGAVAAKLAISALVGFAYCLALEVVSLPLLLLVGSDQARFDATMAAILVAGLVASTLWALVGAGLALLTASSIASTVTVVVWYVLGEGAVRLVLDGLHLDAVGQLLPGSLTVTAFVAIVDGGAAIPAAAALLGLAAWAALLSGLGWWATRTRDIT